MNISDNIEIINNSKYKYIPYKIKYNDSIFYIRGANPSFNLRVTWRCINYRINHNLPENQIYFVMLKFKELEKIKIQENLIIIFEMNIRIFANIKNRKQ